MWLWEIPDLRLLGHTARLSSELWVRGLRAAGSLKRRERGRRSSRETGVCGLRTSLGRRRAEQARARGECGGPGTRRAGAGPPRDLGPAPGDGGPRAPGSRPHRRISTASPTCGGFPAGGAET